MKKFFTAFILVFIGIAGGFAQVVTPPTPADTTQQIVTIHYNIFDDLAIPGANGAVVSIKQPSSLQHSVAALALKNESGFTLDGYRIRLYSDNTQNSRHVSESLVNELAAKYPGVKAYRSYSNPYFRVSIGDFRTLNDARAFLDIIKLEYPKAYPVKEKINLPPL